MTEELKMYVEYRDGKPHGYLYGPSWKAMELYMEGGYPTEEEAKAAWDRESRNFESDPPKDAPDLGVTGWCVDGDRVRCGMCLCEVEPSFKWCPNCGRKRI